jgi:PIN domain nuclease of toxin-antitoxin system
VIVLDTHCWLWWASDPERLSARASATVDQAVADGAVYISSISTWEIAMLVSVGRLELTMEVADWVAKFEALPFVRFVPVDNHVAIRSVELPRPFHSDPADRIIVATALIVGATLITKDDKIRGYRGVRTVW